MIIGLFLHAFYSAVFAYAFANLVGSIGPWTAILSLTFGGIFGYLHGKKLLLLQPNWKFLRFHSGHGGAMEIMLTTFILFIGFRHFAWLLYPVDHHLATLSQTNFGDLPLHINYIRAIANGLDFPLRDPIFSSQNLHYPIGSDLYNALWEVLGARLQAHLFVVGMVATCVCVILLRSFSGWWGIGAFFLSGGLAGWEVISGAKPGDFQSFVDWKNLFLAMFITQRGMLFALPAGLILLMVHRQIVSNEFNFTSCDASGELNRKVQTILGILWGFLPLFHLHAFVILSLLLFSISIINSPKLETINFRDRKSSMRQVFSIASDFFSSRMAKVAYLPAILLIFNSTHQLLGQKAIVRWSWGWLVKGNQIGPYLLLNFGPWLFVPLLIAASLWFSNDIFDRAKRKKLWFELGFYLAWFCLFFNLMLAPWEWDNIKLLIWPYLGFSRLLWVVIEPRMGSVLGFLERPLVAMTLFFSGFMAVVWSTQPQVTAQGAQLRGVSIYKTEDLAHARGALMDVPLSAVFAAAPTHNHALTFYGRLRAVGYGGHLWSHGIDAKEAEEKLDRLLKADSDFVSLARSLGVTHIYWGPEERAKYASAAFAKHPNSTPGLEAQNSPFATQLKNVSRVSGYEIYSVQ